MHVEKPTFTGTGTVTHPADLVGQARKELTPKNFTALMERTGGKPTAADLIRAAEAQRAQLDLFKPAQE